MTDEQAKYVAAFTRGMKHLGVNNVSPRSDGEGERRESYFSWRPCTVCGCKLGGDRYECDGYNPTTREIVEFEACTDCVLFHANGDLPE